MHDMKALNLQNNKRTGQSVVGGRREGWILHGRKDGVIILENVLSSNLSLPCLLSLAAVPVSGDRPFP